MITIFLLGTVIITMIYTHAEAIMKRRVGVWPHRQSIVLLVVWLIGWFWMIENWNKPAPSIWPLYVFLVGCVSYLLIQLTSRTS